MLERGNQTLKVKAMKQAASTTSVKKITQLGPQTAALDPADFLAQTAKASKEAAEELNRDRAKSKQDQADSALGRSGIPKRFVGKRLCDFKPECVGSNKALNICTRYRDNFKDKILPHGVNMIMTGNTGTGKTHLSAAILHNVISHGGSGVFVSVSEMLRFIRSAYGFGAKITEEEAFNTFVKPDLLVLDEVGVAIGDEEKRKAMVFDVINARYNAVKPILLLGNLNAEEMEAYLGQRVWDRMKEGGGPVIPFTWGSHRGKS